MKWCWHNIVIILHYVNKMNTRKSFFFAVIKKCIYFVSSLNVLLGTKDKGRSSKSFLYFILFFHIHLLLYSSLPKFLLLLACWWDCVTFLPFLVIHVTDDNDNLWCIFQYMHVYLNGILLGGLTNTKQNTQFSPLFCKLLFWNNKKKRIESNKKYERVTYIYFWAKIKRQSPMLIFCDIRYILMYSTDSSLEENLNWKYFWNKKYF